MNTQSDKGFVASPAKTKEILARYGLTAKKSLGQNFLTDYNILNKIAEAAELDKSKGVLEIGPGIGALTQQLTVKAGKVVAIEIDQRMLPVLAETLGGQEHAVIIHGDILKTDLGSLFQQYFEGLSAVSVAANLPYYITTPIIMKLLEEQLPLENIVVMLQKEVAERMTARPGGKEYGSLSIAVQYYCQPEIVAAVPPAVFIPRPNVDSVVIRLRVRQTPPVTVADKEEFFEMVRACFAQRRKTISNNLFARYFSKESRPLLENTLQRAGIDPVRRAETLSIQEFADLAAALASSGIPLK